MTDATGNLFPIFLKLAGRDCVVIGAGTIAESKIESLFCARARVTVVAPNATSKIQDWAASQRLRWMQREFEPGDLEHAFLAIAATSTPAVNRAVFEESQRRGVLCNAVDDPPHCDFYFPAIIRRGALQLAISTSGQSPAFAQHVRQELEAALDPQLEEWLAQVSEQRREILATLPPSAERTKLLHDIAGRKALRTAAEPAQPGPTSIEPRAGVVYLVGAGPGNPELLTVKAAALLGGADFILHDDLVAEPILALAGPRAVVLSVGKRCGAKRVTQAEINERMIELSRAGNSVVRLKSGDPLIFGRLGEEIDGLRTAGIPFEIVPGITAGFAAAASLGVSLTDRRTSSRVVLASAHHAEGKNSGRPDWTQVAQPDSTLMIYMPGPDLQQLAVDLLAAGLPSETPCVIVSRVTTPEQRQTRTTLGGLRNSPPSEPPSVLLVGCVLETANHAQIGDLLERFTSSVR